MIYDFQRVLSLRLLALALLDLFLGFVLWQQKLPFWHAFGLQAMLWGGVDALIALFGLHGLEMKLVVPVNLPEASQRTRWLRRILAINTGLDVLYMAAGILLSTILGRGDPFWAGTGWGVFAQGAFLLLFDGLHTLSVPPEIILPELGLLDGPDHETFWLEGGRPAALLIHGFPDTPQAVRDLAVRLHEQGWTTQGLLLPGFGPQLGTLYQRRLDEWVSAIRQEVWQLKQDHAPVLLVGFSLGGGLSILAAADAQPDGLALLAPFVLPRPRWLAPIYHFLRLFTPFSLPVRRLIDLNSPDLRQGVSELAPGVSFDDPHLQEIWPHLRIPFSFLEQFLRLSLRAQPSLARWQGPTLVLQGSADPVARPAWTRGLAHRLGPHTRYCEVPGGHNLNLPGHPSYERVTTELIAFAHHLEGK